MKTTTATKSPQHILDRFALSILRIIIGVFIGMQIVSPLFVAYNNIFVGKSGYDQTPEDYKLEYESLDFYSEDNTLLKGWHIPATDKTQKNPGILLVHGLRANKADLLDIAAIFNKEGFSVFLFDLRAHGLSDGNKVTYGTGEIMDIEAAFRALSQQKDVDEKRLGIYGVSLGASTSILAEADSDFVKNYNKALFLDSPYSSLDKLLETQFPWKYGYITPLAKFLTKQYTKLFLTNNPFSNEPILKIKEIEIPVFFTHGSEDRLIEKEHSEELLNAKIFGKKDLYIVPLAGHLEGRLASQGEYDRKMIQFFKSNLSEK